MFWGVIGGLLALVILIFSGLQLWFYLIKTNNVLLPSSALPGRTFYSCIVDKCNIIDNPMSAVRIPDHFLRGGGIIFISCISLFSYAKTTFEYPWFMLFWHWSLLYYFVDDIRSHFLVVLRLVFHFSGSMSWYPISGDCSLPW